MQSRLERHHSSPLQKDIIISAGSHDLFLPHGNSRTTLEETPCIVVAVEKSSLLAKRTESPGPSFYNLQVFNKKSKAMTLSELFISPARELNPAPPLLAADKPSPTPKWRQTNNQKKLR